MRGKATHYIRQIALQWMLSMVVLFAPDGNALGLGEIQVGSYLGEPLKAQVPLYKLTDVDIQDAKVRLASYEEYKEQNLQYPDGVSFKFQIVNEPGSDPFIRITTLRSIEEPYLNLLVKFSSLSGKVIKAYTFLIDPAPDLVSPPVAAQPVATVKPAVQAEPEQAAVSGSLAGPNQEAEKYTETRKPAAKRKKRNSDMASAPLPDSQTSAKVKASRRGGDRQQSKPFGKLSLTLSTSLSISRNDQGQPGNSTNTSDALQEELIVKEKTLKELNAQIAEMQAVIKLLHAKLNLQSSSSISNAGVVAQSAEASSAPESAVAKTEPAKPRKTVTTITTTTVAEPGNISGLLNKYWQEAAAVLALLLGAGGIFWYRKRKQAEGWMHGPFDNPNELDNAEAPEKIADDAKTKPKPDEPSVKAAEKAIGQPAKTSEPPAKVNEPSAKASEKPAKVTEAPIKLPGSKEQKPEFSAPPEYDLLEEADIYLRFGHDKLAEEVLREAIKINPNNPHSYLTLLGILETRGDVKEFAVLAKQLKALGDDIDWAKAVEMGRRLDPDNPLYLRVIS